MFFRFLLVTLVLFIATSLSDSTKIEKIFGNDENWSNPSDEYPILKCSQCGNSKDCNCKVSRYIIKQILENY